MLLPDEWPWSCSLSSQGTGSSLTLSMTFPHLPSVPISLTVLLQCWGSKLEVVPRQGLTKHQAEGTVPALPWLSAMPCSHHPRHCWPSLLPEDTGGPGSPHCPPVPRATPRAAASQGCMYTLSPPRVTDGDAEECRPCTDPADPAPYRSSGNVQPTATSLSPPPNPVLTHHCVLLPRS